MLQIKTSKGLPHQRETVESLLPLREALWLIMDSILMYNRHQWPTLMITRITLALWARIPLIEINQSLYFLIYY